WDTLNMIASIGSGIFGLGTGLTLINVFWSRRHGEVAGDDPWKADSLEWATTSPPPDHNFDVVPLVRSRHPLWDDDPEMVDEDAPAVAAGLGIEGAVGRQTPVTGGLAATAEVAMTIPQPTALPLLLAFGIAVFFAGMLVSAALVIGIGVAVGLTGLVRWAWHTEVDHP
ncbi:MAG TPA: hypothetical protein VGM78_10445, partial [Ilumatobacteraceae bacterium]